MISQCCGFFLRYDGVLECVATAWDPEMSYNGELNELDMPNERAAGACAWRVCYVSSLARL